MAAAIEDSMLPKITDQFLAKKHKELLLPLYEKNFWYEQLKPWIKAYDISRFVLFLTTLIGIVSIPIFPFYSLLIILMSLVFLVLIQNIGSEYFKKKEQEYIKLFLKPFSESFIPTINFDIKGKFDFNQIKTWHKLDPYKDLSLHKVSYQIKGRLDCTHFNIFHAEIHAMQKEMTGSSDKRLVFQGTFIFLDHFPYIVTENMLQNVPTISEAFYDTKRYWGNEFQFQVLQKGKALFLFIPETKIVLIPEFRKMITNFRKPQILKPFYTDLKHYLLLADAIEDYYR